MRVSLFGRLCVLVVSLGTVLFADSARGQSFGFNRELWTNLTTSLGNTLNALTNPVYNAQWATNPAAEFTTNFFLFEAETTTGRANYGQRVRGYVIPPVSGNYRFWVASDDDSALLLGSGESPTGTTVIASVDGATGSRAWTTFGSQQSALISLERGKRYYIEGQMQQGGGGDNFAVRWQLPSGTIEEPMAATSSVGSLVVPFNGVVSVPGLFRQPASTTVVENASAFFGVVATNRAQLFYQWFSNGVAVAGRTEAAFTITNATPGMSGTVFRCEISNALGVVTSATAVLSVLSDTNPPVILSAYNAGLTNVVVTFSEPVTADSLTNLANYAITNAGVSVLGALAATSGVSVTLVTTPMVLGSSYWVRVNGLADFAAVPNVIATNSSALFTVLAWSQADIGSPGTNSSASEVTTNGMTIAAAGGQVDGTSDQFSLYWQQRSGNFDIKVRLASVSLADAWSKAGLMARSDLNAGSLFAAAFATPSIAGCYFQSRTASNAAATMVGSAPVNYPNTWLRLQRATNTFLGYASLDGVNWSLMGSVAIATMPTNCYVGLAVSSHQTNSVTTTAQFREITDATGQGLGSFVPKFEPLGASSRRSGLTFSEIHYNPAPRADGKNLEFVEIFNSRSVAEDMSGQRLSGAIDYTFPAGTVLKAGDFLVVARVPADVMSVYGIANVYGPYTNGLPNGGGTLRLRSELGALQLEVNYDDERPWPVSADGAGHSLVLARASYGEDDPRAWAASDLKGGSPGAVNSISSNAYDGIFINEFLAHTDLPLVDYLELYNHNYSARDVSGCWLSDKATTNLYQIPNGTVIPARGFLMIDETALGFRLDSMGGAIFLTDSNNTRVIDAVDFGAQQNSVSAGRVPDGGSEIYQLASRTPGAANGARKIQDIVINELMYSPISGNADDQYVELYNRASSNVDLSAWQFVSGISFTFPTNTVIPANGYLVVAKNVTNLLAKYPQLNAGNCIGNFDGQLSGGGERVALGFPDYNIQTDLTVVVSYMVVSEVSYKDGGRWGTWSDGEGSSLELVNPSADTRVAVNWADSDESSKTSAWTTIEYTGPLMETVYSPVNDQLHVYLLGRGECLVDEVELLTNGISVVVTNGGFEAGQGPWTFLGAYDQSTVVTGGFAGANALRVRGSTRGDTGANRIQSATFPPMNNGTTGVTLRMKARWLRGWPEVILRMHGGSIEATGAMPIPPNLGSPGLVNSRYVSNAPPAISAVNCAPVFPQVGEGAVITALVEDPNGLGAVSLLYRLDPATNFTTIGMNDGGTNGDAVASDGIFSATIPAQSSGQLVAYHVRAADAAGATGTFPRVLFPTTSVRLFPSDSVSDELLVRWGEVQMPGGYANYHMWMTSTNRGRWQYRDNLNNSTINGTFIYNNVRAVHSAGMSFGGSPFHRGNMTTGPDGSNRNDYNCIMPDDDQVLGVTDLTYIVPGNGSGGNTTDLTGISEQAAHLIFRAIGVSYLNRRHVHVFFNGSQRSTFSGLAGNMYYEDAQQPNSAYLDQWFDGRSDGYLHKIEDWFEFNTNGTAFSNNDADFTRRVITGTTNLNKAAYRFMFRPRALGPGESGNDYSKVFDMVNALSPTLNNNEPVNFPLVNDQADLEEWYREIACQRTVGNYDSYGWNRGKNNFFYWPPNDRCILLPWDVDQIMGLSGSQPTNAALTGGSDPRSTVALPAVPAVFRHYMRAFNDILNGPLKPGWIEAKMDELVAGHTANGVVYSASQLTTQKNYIEGRRGYIAAQIARYQTNFAVTLPTNNAVVTGSNIVTLVGNAPIEVADITINGAKVSVTWVTSNQWNFTYALLPMTNSIVIGGVDRFGVPVTNASQNLTIIYNGSTPSPTGLVVFSEIHYKPATPNGGFVELYNNSANTAFDLGGWQINGIGYTFPSGTIILPRQFLTIADDIFTVQQSGANTNVPFGEYTGNLDPDGETLSLLRNDAQTTVVARVRYEAVAPWPAATNIGSLQLRDSTNDISRVSNWDAVVPSEWTYFATTGLVNNATNLMLFAGNSGTVYLDDLRASYGNADTGLNRVVNGDFESPLAGTWNLADIFTNSVIVTNVKRSGAASLKLIADGPGSLTHTGSIWQTVSPQMNVGNIIVSFWFIATPASNAFTFRPNNVFPIGNSYTATTTVSAISMPAFATPGASNSVVRKFAPYPSLWLNEVSASNTTVITDNAAEREPWVELYNSGTGTLSLAGLYLSDDYTNLTKWAFPAGATLTSNSFRIVWCDAQTNQQNNTTNLHASFRLPPTSGRVALSRITNGTPQIIDYLNYTNLPVNWSYGDIPDGQPFYRTPMYLATSGGTNNGAALPATISINEWAADNTTVVDPADGNSNEDWIELFNYGTQTVDLAGFYLTDNLTNPNQWSFPTNTLVPPGGFLLVWADNETNQNAIANGDRHTSFRLAAGGEQIGLYSPSLVVVDSVTFGPQTTDITQGRWPDASSSIYTLAYPTPRTNNVVSTNNTAPQFLGPTAYTNNELTLFTATISATDTDSPPQTLTYTLATVPAGMTLNTNTGAITWTPTEANGPDITNFTLIATDNGTPKRSTTQTITLVIAEVNLPPQPQTIAPLATYPGSYSFAQLIATDPDLPANSLTYALAPGAPANSSVTPNGLVTYLPDLPDADTLVTVPVLVTDNGIPALTATGSLTFAVGSATNLFNLNITATRLLQWNAISGATYRLEYTENLLTLPWTHLTNQTAPADGPVQFTDPAATNSTRYYRLFHQQ